MIAPLSVKELPFVAATVPPLEVVRLKGLATVIVAVVSKVPPDRVTVPVGLFKLVGLEIDKTPALIVVPPVKVFVPDRVDVPAPL